MNAARMPCGGCPPHCSACTFGAARPVTPRDLPGKKNGPLVVDNNYGCVVDPGALLVQGASGASLLSGDRTTTRDLTPEGYAFLAASDNPLASVLAPPVHSAAA